MAATWFCRMGHLCEGYLEKTVLIAGDDIDGRMRAGLSIELVSAGRMPDGKGAAGAAVEGKCDECVRDSGAGSAGALVGRDADGAEMGGGTDYVVEQLLVGRKMAAPVAAPGGLV